MKKTIITIERQYGSGGSIIGKLAAEKLGINFYNRQILEMTAAFCIRFFCRQIPQEQSRTAFPYRTRFFSWKAV